MSLHPQEPPSVPDDTRRVARGAFPTALSVCILPRHSVHYHDSQFAALFTRRGQPAEAPGLLALVTVLQFVEGLSDRQPADALRGRIDWKYVLDLSLADPGFDHTVLSEFRSRLVEGGAERLLLGAERLLLDALLRRLRDLSLQLQSAA
jgi:transposase